MATHGGASLSSWRAWIEIISRQQKAKEAGRSPHGERGLKSIRKIAHGHKIWSLSSWRAWIEILICLLTRFNAGRSPHGERGLK